MSMVNIFEFGWGVCKGGSSICAERARLKLPYSTVMMTSFRGGADGRWRSAVIYCGSLRSAFFKNSVEIDRNKVLSTAQKIHQFPRP